MRNRKTLAAIGLTAAIAGGSVLGATLGVPFASGAQESTTTTAPTEQSADAPRPGPGHGHGGFDLDTAAETLGLTTDELQAQLAEGKTLAAIAEEQGVEKQALIDALVASATEKLDEAKAELPERIAELVDSELPARGEGGPGGPGGHGGPGGRGPGLDVAAEALGITADELRTELEADKTIAEVAEAQGVDVQTVIDAMVADHTERLAQAVEDGELTQEEADAKKLEITERVTTMVDEGMPAGGPGHGPHGDDAPAGEGD